MSRIVGAKNGRGGRWVPESRVVLDHTGKTRPPQEVTLRADQCLHFWLPTPNDKEAPRSSKSYRCNLCPATMRRGEDGKVESYSAGLKPPAPTPRPAKPATTAAPVRQ